MTTETHATAAASGAGATARFREDKQVSAATSQERVSALAGRIIKAINDTVVEEKVTYDEYNALKSWLIKVGEDGEWPLRGPQQDGRFWEGGVWYPVPSFWRPLTPSSSPLPIRSEIDL